MLYLHLFIGGRFDGDSLLLDAPQHFIRLEAPEVTPCVYRPCYAAGGGIVVADAAPGALALGDPAYRAALERSGDTVKLVRCYHGLKVVPLHGR